MDNAVALVRAYLHVTGYFTVTDYPVIEAARSGGYDMATDLDILAFRFPGAARTVPGKGGGRQGEISVPDPELHCPEGRADMLVGEVKEGRAALNPGIMNRKVLEAMLTRFGCCAPGDLPGVAKVLMRKGHADTPSGHHVRFVAFGSASGESERHGYRVISLGHVVQFLQTYLRRNWDVLHHAQFKDPALGFLVALEKASRAADAGRG